MTLTRHPREDNVRCRWCRANRLSGVREGLCLSCIQRWYAGKGRPPRKRLYDKTKSTDAMFRRVGGSFESRSR